MWLICERGYFSRKASVGISYSGCEVFVVFPILSFARHLELTALVSFYIYICPVVLALGVRDDEAWHKRRLGWYLVVVLSEYKWGL